MSGKGRQRNKRLQMQKPEQSHIVSFKAGAEIVRRGLINGYASPEWIAEQKAKGNIPFKGKSGQYWSLANRMYSPIEVMTFVDEGAVHILNTVDEWGERDYSELLQAYQELRDRVSDVIGYVRRTPGDFVRSVATPDGIIIQKYAFSGDELRAISGLTIQLLTIISRMEIDRTAMKALDETLEAGESVGRGLGFLLSNTDKGDELRKAATTILPPAGNIHDWINITKSGRKPTDGREKEARSWWHNKLIEASETCTRAEAYEGVRNWLYSKRDHLINVELWAFEWLEGQEANPRSDPCGTLWKSIDRAAKRDLGAELLRT